MVNMEYAKSWKEMKYRGKYKRRVCGLKSFMKEIDCNIYGSRIIRVFSHFIVLNTSIKLKINLSAGVANRIYKLGVLII